MSGRRPWLRIHDGGEGERLRCGRLEVVLAPPDAPPFAVAGRVVAEDTWLVLSSPVAVTPPAEHPLRLFSDLHAARPEAPGSLVVREGVPLQLLAVIYDFDRTPTCRSAWVGRALAAACSEAAARGLTSLAVPLLGHAHGGLGAAESAAALAAGLARAPHGRLRRIWLEVAEEEREEVLAGLLGRGGRSGGLS